MPDLTVSGATATLTFSADPGTPSLGGDMTVSGATATFRLQANAGTPSVPGGPINIPGATAHFTLAANSASVHVGNTTSVPGDYFVSPIQLSGLSGSLTVDLQNSTTEAGEPNETNILRSVWLVLTPSTTGIFVIRGTDTDFDYTIEMYEGQTLDSLYLSSSASWVQATSSVLPEITFNAGANGPYYVRITPYDLTSGSDPSIHLTWSFDQRLPVLVLQVRTPDVTQTPSSCRVSVMNADPNEVVSFTLTGHGVIYTQAADETGVIASISIPLPELVAGTYIITATGESSGRSDQDAVQILNDPVPRPTSLVADTPPSPVPQTGVRKWVLQDPAPGGVEYIFPINPSTMKPIFQPKYVNAERTTSPTGQAIVWQGAARAFEWSFEGYLETQEFLDQLTAFYNLNRRFWLIDHRNRAWIVSFEKFDPQPKRNVEKPYAHNYTMEALIYGGPVQL